MTGLFKRRWTDEELDQVLDEFTTFTSNAMMPLEYARAVSRRYGASEHQVLLVVLKRVKDGRIRLVNGRIPVRQEGEARIRALLDEPHDSSLEGWELFRHLIRYYINCVRAEGGCSFTLWGDKFGKNFSFLERSGIWHPSRADKKWSVFVGADSVEYFEGLGLPESGDLYLGYPVFVTTVKQTKKKAAEGEEADPTLEIRPIFCWKLSCVRQRGISGWSVSLAEEQPDPEVNLSWLSKALKRADQKRAFLEECGLFDDGRNMADDEGYLGEDEEGEVAAQGSTSLSNWDFRELASVVSTMFRERLAEPLSPEHVVARPVLQPGVKPGFYNRAVLFTALPSPYTKRLLSELDFIAKADDAVLDRTALKHFFVLPKKADAAKRAVADKADSTNASEGATPDRTLHLADAIDLKGNEFTVAQRSAVASMLANPITVMQGPPGTGKSQVVAGVALNERLRQQTVLISASNHKAIDAVVERIGKFQATQKKEGERESKLSFNGPLVTRCNSKNPDEKDFSMLQACEEILREAGRTPQARERESAENRRKAFDALLENRAKLVAEADRLNGLAADMEEADVERYALERRAPWVVVTGNRVDIARIKGFDKKCLLDTLEVLGRNDGQMFLTFMMRPLSTWRLVAWSKLVSAWTQKSDSNVVAPKFPEMSLFARMDLEAVQALYDCTKDLFTRVELVERVEKYCEELKREPRTAADVAEEIQKISAVLREKSFGVLLEDAASRRYRAREGDGTGVIANVRNVLRDLQGIDGRRERYFSPKLFDGLSRVLVDRPVWAVTSLSAGKFIPPVPGLFDLVLVDEATQSNIAQAIPLLFRARRAAVIGDPMQLQYITVMRPDRDFILRKREGVLEEDLRRFSYCENSLYDFAAAAVTDASQHVELDITYRSWPIFYGGRLLVGTKEERLQAKAPAGRFGISWEKTRGSVEQVPGGSCICRAEVDAVVRVVKSILLGTNFRGTLGVVSPFHRQAQLIDAEVCERADIPRERLESVEFISSTAHALQGDERDVIIMSLCSNDSMPQGCRNFISKDPNIFNVAASRARASLIVVGDYQWAQTCGIRHIEGLTHDWSRAFEPPVTPWAPYESPYEERLGKKLREAGLSVKPQVRVGVRRLDLGLQLGAAKLDIEVDSDAWHRDETGHRRQEDVWRDEELARHGWKTLRIWTFEIDTDIAQCVERVKREWAELCEKVNSKNVRK